MDGALDFGEGALLVVSSLSLLVHLLLGVWRSSGVRRPWSWFKEWMFLFLWGIQWEDGVDQAVAEKLANTQTRLGTLMNSATLNLYSVSVLVSLFLGRPESFEASQEILLITLHLELLFLAHLPEKRRTHLVIECFYGIISLTMVIYKVLHPSTAVGSTSLDQNLLTLPRLLLAVCHFHPLSVLAWNLSISLSIIFSAASQDIDIMQGEWASLVRNELMSTFAFFLVSFCCWLWMLECSRRDVATAMLQVERSASRSLLGMACDVVVQLDEHLQLTQDSPQLAAMFFRRPDMAETGADFLQFFRPEDAENFRDMLTNSTMKLGTPGTGCFRATFTDGIRNTIRCDLFFVKLRLLEAGSQARFHIGIRETSEFKALTELKKPSEDKLKRSRTGPAILRRKGTAAYSETQNLHPDMSKSADSLRVRHEENLRFKNLRKTTGDAMSFDLMCLVADWNVHVPPTSCCSTHASLLHARKILKGLEKGPCAKHPDQEPTAMQCRRCGRLDFEMEPGDMDFECPACCGMEFWPCGEYERRLLLSSGDDRESCASRESQVGSRQSLDSMGRPLPSLPEHPPRPGTFVLSAPMGNDSPGTTLEVVEQLSVVHEVPSQPPDLAEEGQGTLSSESEAPEPLPKSHDTTTQPAPVTPKRMKTAPVL